MERNERGRLVDNPGYPQRLHLGTRRRTVVIHSTVEGIRGILHGEVRAGGEGSLCERYSVTAEIGDTTWVLTRVGRDIESVSI